MSRENPRYLRARLAQLAAQLMAEHGIRDHALAKRKAARQLGVVSANVLPSNEEIDEALKAHMALFEPEDFERDLEAVQRQAAEVMTMLESFQPVLTGALVQGVAAPHQAIELEIFSDSSKDFERFLLNRDIPFKVEERRGISIFTLYAEPTDIEVRVMPEQTAHARRSLTVEQLRRLLAEKSTEAGAAGD